MEKAGVLPLIRRAFAGEAVTIDPIGYVPERGAFAGRTRWCGAYAYPVTGPDGQVEEVVLIHHDLTDRTAAEDAMRQSQQRLETLFEHAQDAILLADDTGRYVDANPAACVLTGYDRPSLLNRSVFDLAPPGDRPAIERAWEQFLRDGRQTGDLQIRHRDGETVDVDFRAVANIQPGLHLSVIRDARDRKRVIRRLEGLYVVSAALSEALTQEDVARVTVEQGIEALGASAGSLGLLTQEGTHLEMVGWHGYGERVVEQWQRVALASQDS